MDHKMNWYYNPLTNDYICKCVQLMFMGLYNQRMKKKYFKRNECKIKKTVTNLNPSVSNWSI